MYKGYKVYDVHGHVSPGGQAGQYAALLLASNGLNKSPLLGGPYPHSEDSYREAAARHVTYMDDRDVDVQIIGPRPFMMLGHVMENHSLRLWTDHVNAMIANQCKWFPDRFLGAAQLPQDDTAADSTHMLETLEHCVRELGFVATYVSPDPQGRRNTPGLHEPYWYPLYEKCIDLDIPIIIHGTNTVDKRFYIVPNNYQLGFAIEQFIAWQILANSDVFERYPQLRVVVCHCGGALNRFMKSDKGHSPQRDTSNNLFYDTCAYDTDFLTAAIRQRGVSQMCFGAEAPGSGGAPRTEADKPGKTADDLVPVLDSFEWLTDADRQAILHANPLKVTGAFDKV